MVPCPILRFPGCWRWPRCKALGCWDGSLRSDQGRDHPVAVVLTLCAAAVLAGMRSFTAIAGWIADLPAELLAGLYLAPTPAGPSKTTLWRVLTGVDAAAVDAAIGSWLAEQARHATAAAAPDTDPADGADHADGTQQSDGPLLAVAVDGKTVRGAVAANSAPGAPDGRGHPWWPTCT